MAPVTSVKVGSKGMSAYFRAILSLMLTVQICQKHLEKRLCTIGIVSGLLWERVK
jgi:hypothetical protein